MGSLVQLLPAKSPAPGRIFRRMRIEAGQPVRFGSVVVTLLQDVDSGVPTDPYFRLQAGGLEGFAAPQPMTVDSLQLLPRALEFVGARVDAVYLDCAHADAAALQVAS